METTQSTGLSQPIKSVEQTVEPDKIKTVREYLRPSPPSPLYQHSRENLCFKTGSGKNCLSKNETAFVWEEFLHDNSVLGFKKLKL